MAKILIVDDRPTNRQFLLTLLGYGGHELLEAADGSEALQRVYAHRPDLVITDILMPTMSGYEFVQQLRTSSMLAMTPVIFYTATYSEPQAQLLADACGVRIVLPKPCEPERVIAAVNEMLHLAASAVLPEPAQRRIETAAKDANLVEDAVSDYLHELQTIRLGFERLAEGSALGSHEAIRTLSDQFSKTIAGLTLMASRLAAVVKAGLGLLSEPDAEHMVQHCFDAACSVVGSTYAAIAVFDESEAALQYLFTKSLDSDLYRSADTRETRRLLSLLDHGHALRLKAKPGETIAGFPTAHPPVPNVLGVPIASSGQQYGWMYFADRLGAEEFTEEDERIVSTLALQLALLHENVLLYNTLRDHAVQLQLEVTERKRAESEVRQLNETLERRITKRTAELARVNEELEAFSYSVSHDLRAPLRALQGFSKLLEEDLTRQSISPQQQGYLRHIVSSSQRMATLIDALLRLAQIGRQRIEKRPVKVGALVEEILADIGAQEPNRSVAVSVGMLPDCLGDASLLKQVFANLLGNAFKFTRNTDAPTVSVGWSEQDGEGTYFVQDNGAGFDMQYSTKLFGTFERAHDATQFEGMGIGLSIVQRIVQRHGGRVWAQGAVGVGASFFVVLPRV